ncbi:MAG: nucleotidyltransferase family protein [Paracoccaceae bacterium]
MSVAPESWPIALRVLSGCLDTDLTDATRRLAQTMTDADWHSLVHLACTRHRVAPVIALHLDDLGAPPGTIEEVRQETRACALETLRQGAALKELLSQLSDAAVDAVILKGLPLGERLYGAAGNRHARDIDILIPPAQIQPAAAILDRLGYTPAPVYRLRGKLVGSNALAQECYDLEYVGGRGHLSVELHWRTSHYAGWPDFTEEADMTRAQDTSFGPVRVPSDPANLIYLAGHGSMHAWARLKWLADIGRLARIRGAEALAEDMALAGRLGGQVPLALALRLAHRVMGSPLPKGLERPTPQIAKLEKQMLRVVAAPEIAPGTWRYRWSANVVSLQLAEGPAQVVGVLRYAIWRRLRLGAAGLVHALGGRPAVS